MYKICLVVPCYNESERLQTESFVKFAEKNHIHFLFVNDGSTDNTLEIITTVAEKCPTYLSAVSVPQNGGKAEAVRFGVNKALENDNSFDFIGYYDSDQATPLNEVLNAIRYLQDNPEFEMLMGMRLKRLGSKVNRDLKRHYLGRIFATFVSITLNLPTYDTQCGFKLIKTSLVKEVFKDVFTSKWFFDVEVLFRIKNWKGIDFVKKHVYEFPLFAWEEVGGSKITLKDYFTVPFELIKIRMRYRS